MSNNSNPKFTDQELITIQIYNFIRNYYSVWFPLLPSYQTFVFRLNHLEPSFQTLGDILLNQLETFKNIEVDHIVDSMPVMLARAWPFL
jgi:hypothetical protein